MRRQTRRGNRRISRTAPTIATNTQPAVNVPTPPDFPSSTVQVRPIHPPTMPRNIRSILSNRRCVSTKDAVKNHRGFSHAQTVSRPACPHTCDPANAFCLHLPPCDIAGVWCTVILIESDHSPRLHCHFAGEEVMAGKIFINYRRGDDPGHTGRLFDRLQDTFAPETAVSWMSTISRPALISFECSTSV